MSTCGTSEDGLPATDTMESFLDILHGLSRDSSPETSTENLENAHIDEDNFYNEVNLGDHEEELENVVFQEYLSSKFKIEKTAFAHAAGHSTTDLHIKEIILPTSVRRVSVPSVLVQQSFDKTPPKSASILHASAPFSKMQPARLCQTSRISKGSTILRSTGSTWMTKAPKFAEKSFSKYTRYVIDTSIMNLKPDLVDFEIPKDKEFEKIIKSAHPKANSNVKRSEVKAEVKKSVNGDIGYEHFSEHEPTADNSNTDSVDKSMFRLLRTPSALADYRSASHNFSGIELETTKLFSYLSKPHSYEFQMNKLLRARGRIRDLEIPVDANMTNECEMLAEGNVADMKTATSNEFHTAKDFEKMKGHTPIIDKKLNGSSDKKVSQKMTEIETENTEIFDDIVCFKKTDTGCRMKDDVLETRATDSHDSNECFIVQRNTMDLGNCVDAEANEKNSRDTMSRDKMSTINIPEAELNSEAIPSGSNIWKDGQRITDNTKIYLLHDRCTDFEGVFYLRSFFKLCNKKDEKKIKRNYDDAFDLRPIFRLSSRTDENGPDDVFNLASFFKLCDRMNKMDDDLTFNLASFFKLCDRTSEMDDDHVFDLASFFRSCTRDRDKKYTNDVFDLGLLFQLCSRNDKKMDCVDADNVLDLRTLFEPYELDRGMKKIDLSRESVSNIHEINGNDRITNEIDNFGYGNNLEVTEEDYEGNADRIDAVIDDSYIDTEEYSTVEERHSTETAAIGIGEISDFGEDSVFGILGVFCRSELHSWDAVHSTDESQQHFVTSYFGNYMQLNYDLIQ